MSELHKINDIIEIREQGGAGRMVYLLPSSERTPSPEEGTDNEVKVILLLGAPVAQWVKRCPTDVVVQV